ncbi:putative retrotransposon protein [Tanacetum coccineum]
MRFTSKIPMEVEGFEPPQEEVIPIRRSKRTHRALNRLYLNVEVEVHSLWDLNEPTRYKAATLDPESNKWIDAMNAEIQSMIDNMVWVLVDLPPNSRLVAKGYSQLYGVWNYVEAFSVADISFRILIVYSGCSLDYEMWQMDVKTFFLNGYLDEDIYMVLDLNKTQGASTPKEVKRMQNVPYASVVGSIMYAVRCTRPDVAFAQNITSRFQQNLGELHWTAVKNILKYLRNTKDMFLVYGGNLEAELRVDCYCDAGFEIDRGAVDWKLNFELIATEMSATEAKYIAASEAVMEAVWIWKFISGLGIVPTINEPIRMFCDNSAALHFANEPGVQRGARHYHRRYHYVRESIALGEMRFLKVHTDDKLADPFTKALSKGKLTQHARSMGLRLASSFILAFAAILPKWGCYTTAMPNVGIPQGIDTGGSPRHQETMGYSCPGKVAGDGNFELTDNVTTTPYDSPLTGGYTLRTDKGRMKLDELITLCTKLSKQVLDLEKEKDAQAVEILNLKKRRFKKLIRRMHLKQGRRSDKIKPMFTDMDFEELDDHMENVEEETIDAATTGVSTAEPRTPPTSNKTVFNDEDVTMEMA